MDYGSDAPRQRLRAKFWLVMAQQRSRVGALGMRQEWLTNRYSPASEPGFVHSKFLGAGVAEHRLAVDAFRCSEKRSTADSSM